MVIDVSPVTRSAQAQHVGGEDDPGKRHLDRMIHDRAPILEGSWYEPIVWPLIKAMVGYDSAIGYVREWAKCASGIEMIEAMHAAFRPEVTCRGLSNVPPAGEGCLIVGNHPTGLPDGVALFDKVSQVRRDVAIIVFHDLININPRATDALIPHDWRPKERTLAKTRETLRLTTRAFQENRLVAVFPSGDLAYWNGLRLRDAPWQKTFITFARRFEKPIIPFYIKARNSIAYYAMRQVSVVLRDLYVIREIQNKVGARFDLTFGPRIEYQDLAGDPDEVTTRLKRYVEDVLPQNPDAHFRDI